MASKKKKKNLKNGSTKFEDWWEKLKHIKKLVAIRSMKGGKWQIGGELVVGVQVLVGKVIKKM